MIDNLQTALNLAPLLIVLTLVGAVQFYRRKEADKQKPVYIVCIEEAHTLRKK